MEAARGAGSAPPDCAASSTERAMLVLPCAVAAASAAAMLALGAEIVKGTSTAAAAWRRRWLAGAAAAGAPEMLTAHAAGKPWSRTSAAFTMSVSASPPGVPKAKADAGCEVVSVSDTSKAPGAGAPGAGDVVEAAGSVRPRMSASATTPASSAPPAAYLARAPPPGAAAPGAAAAAAACFGAGELPSIPLGVIGTGCGSFGAAARVSGSAVRSTRPSARGGAEKGLPAEGAGGGGGGRVEAIFGPGVEAAGRKTPNLALREDLCPKSGKEG